MFLFVLYFIFIKYQKKKKMKTIKSQKQFWNENTRWYTKAYQPEDKNYKIIQSLKPCSKVLCLGCGGGREVRELYRWNHKITAVDFSKNMIQQSKRIEPNADYYCMDVIDFVELFKDYKKFDYILGLFSFLNYIKKEDRKKLIEDLYSMLNPKGRIFFEVRMINDRPTDIIKTLIAPLFIKVKEFGDVYSGHGTISHHYTDLQLFLLFNKYKYKRQGNIIWVDKDEHNT